MTGDAVSPLPTHVSCRNRGRHRRILSRVARPSPSPSAHGAARARAVRPRAAPPGRARGQGPAPIVPRRYCTRFAASAGAIRLSTRTSGRRDGAGGGDGGERGTVGTDGTDGTDGADGAGGTTNCRRCADGLRRGLGSFTMGKPALRPSPAAGACHVGSVPKGSFFLSFRKTMTPSPLECTFLIVLQPRPSKPTAGSALADVKAEHGVRGAE